MTAEEYLLAAAYPPRQKGELYLRIQHDAADPDDRRVMKLVGSFRVAVRDDPRRIHTTGQCDGQLPAGAHIQADALFGDRVRHRRGQQRLAGVAHFNPGRVAR